MAEALSAEISFATQEAYQNLGAFLNAIQNAQNSLNVLGTALGIAESDAKKLASAFEKAEKQFKQTGAEADRMKMEELRASMTHAGERATDLKMKYETLENSLKHLSKEQGNATNETLAAAKKLQDSSKRTADVAVEQDKRVKDALDDAKKGTDAVSVGFGKIADSMLGVGASLFSLRQAVEVVKELEEHTKAVVEARIKLGEIKVGVDEKIQSVIDNLGFLPGAAGQNRARGLVQALQSRAPGLTAEAGAEMLARFQATGYKVADAARPDLDTKAPAFDIAAEAARFATRQRLDPDTAGKLANIAQLQGVRTSQDMEKMLASMEARFNEIAVTNPQELMKGAIQASAARMSQGVSLEQSLSQFAAAAVTQPDTARAATSVEQFSRTAAGASPQHAQFLAQLAQQRGLISPQAMAQATAEVRPTIKGDNVREIEAARLAVEKDRADLERSSRERADMATDFAEQEQRFNFEIQQLAREAADPKKRKQVPEIQERERRAREDWAKYQREATEKLRDADTKDRDIQGRIRGTDARIAEMQAKDTAKLTAAATLRAFESLPLAARENLLYQATEGMTAAQIGVFSAQAAEGDIAQQLATMLGPTARAARQRALAAGTDVTGYRQRNAAFQTNTLAQKSATEIAAEQAATKAMEPGTEFFNNANVLAQRDIEILKAKGEGQTGFIAATKDQLFAASPTRTGSDEMLRARRIIIIVRDQFVRFMASSGQKAKGQYAQRITDAYAKLNALWTKVYQPETSFNAGADRLKDVQELASMIGALIADMQRFALESGESPGLSGAAGLDLPANRPGFGLAEPALSPEQLGAGALGPPAPAAGGGAGASNVAGGPRASAAGATYNINVSTLVSQGAESFDLPARLGVPDLS